MPVSRSYPSGTPLRSTGICAPLYTASAWSLIVGSAISTPSMLAIAATMLSALDMAFPLAAFTMIGGSSLASLLPMRLEKPLNTDNTHTIAAVVTTTPHIATIEMMLTAL